MCVCECVCVCVCVCVCPACIVFPLTNPFVFQVASIAAVYKSDRAKYDQTAREWTQKYAM